MKSVDIVLATYRPDMKFLKKLLNSLNSQDYPDLKLIVRDDSEDDLFFEQIRELLRSCISAFDYKIYKNDKNLGSNKTFEMLTMDATSDYIAYCDQDDIWEANKISALVVEIEKKKSLLCYSDLSIINEADELTASSFKKIHKRLLHVEGENLFEFFLRRNSVTGCTMLIKSEVAKAAVPFLDRYYVHDHWLALFASSRGRISYVPKQLVQYRIHGNNQIGAKMLVGIDNRNDYYKQKLLTERQKYKQLLELDIFNQYQLLLIESTLKFLNTRINYFESRNLKTTLKMLGTVKKDYQLILFELGINTLPEILANHVIEKVKDNGDL